MFKWVDDYLEYFTENPKLCCPLFIPFVLLRYFELQMEIKHYGSKLSVEKEKK